MPAFALHIDSCKQLFDQFKLRKQSLNFALVAIGSVLTDLEEFGVVKGLHWKGEKFLAHLLKTDPKYAPLAVGMIMHEEMDKTLDKHYIEPNIIHADAILQKYGTKTFDNEGHYFLDHAMTCSFVENDPQIITITEQARNRLKDRHMHKIAYHLSTYFGGNQAQIISALAHFRTFDLSAYLSSEKIADVYGKFSLLRDAMHPEKRTWFDKAKLVVRYVQFILSNKRTLIHRATEDAKLRFKNHKPEYNKACTAMKRRFTKLNAAYQLSIK